MTTTEEQQDSQLDLVVVEDSDLDVEMLSDALHDAGINIGIRRASNEAAFRAAMEQ